MEQNSIKFDQIMLSSIKIRQLKLKVTYRQTSLRDSKLSKNTKLIAISIRFLADIKYGFMRIYQNFIPQNCNLNR